MVLVYLPWRRAQLKNQSKLLHAVDLELVLQPQVDDQHPKVPATSTSTARVLASEVNFVVLDQTATCDVTVTNLILAKSGNPGLQFLDKWPQVCLPASKGSLQL